MLSDHPIELKDEIITFPTGKVAKWNAACRTSSGVLGGLGIKVHPKEYRFTHLPSQLKGRLTWGPVAQRPWLILGTSHTGQEVRTFPHQVKKIQPPCGAFSRSFRDRIAQSASLLWAQCCWADSSALGDVSGGCWNVFLCTRRPLVLPTIGYTSGMTLATRYDDMKDAAGRNPRWNCGSTTFLILWVWFRKSRR